MFITSSFVHHFKSIDEFKVELQSRKSQFGSNLAIFCPVWPWNLMDDLGKQQDTSSILRKAVCIVSKPWVKSNCSYNPETWNSGQNPETLNSGQNQRFVARVTLQSYGWPWKTIRHLFYTTPSFLHHFQAMGEFKLELQVGNFPFGSKSATFCPMWPWNLMDDLEKKKAPLLSCVKLCASFQSNGWIQTGVTVRKRSIRFQIGIFFTLWLWYLTDDIEKQ